MSTPARSSTPFGANPRHKAPHRFHIDVEFDGRAKLTLHEAGRHAATERHASCEASAKDMRALAAQLLAAAERAESLTH